MTCDEIKPLLNARLDEEIDPAQRADFDAHVKTCSACAKELEDLERVRRSIRGGMPYYQAPAHLRNQVRFALRGAGYVDSRARRQISWKPWGAIAAAITVCGLISAPFFVNARNRGQLVAEELLSAHERALAGRSVDVISSDQHTVKPWFNGKLPFSPPVADLRAEGFPLEGGRLDYVGERPVAALVYTRRLHRIDVFIWPAANEKAPPGHFERNGYSEISWTKDNFLFTAISDLNAVEMTVFTRLLQTQ
jgi:anti-sigma factor RsiW